VQADSQCQGRSSGLSRYSGLPSNSPSLQKRNEHTTYLKILAAPPLHGEVSKPTIKHLTRSPTTRYMHSHRTQQGIANSHSYSTTSHSTTSHCQQVITTSHIHMSAHLARADDDSVGETWMDDDSGVVPGVGPVLLLPPSRSSLSSSSPLLLHLLFLHPYSIAPSPFLLFSGSWCGE
jgi:hypothetical protein